MFMLNFEQFNCFLFKIFVSTNLKLIQVVGNIFLKKQVASKSTYFKLLMSEIYNF